MRILLTGATGFLGRNLLDALVRLSPADCQIVCLVRNPEASPWLATQSSKIQILQADLTQPETLTPLLGHFDAVFHVAAKVSLTDGADFYTVNTQGTAHLLQALKRCTVGRLVFISSIAAVDRPLDQKPPFQPLTVNSPAVPSTDYGRSKRQAEELIEASGLPYTILRPAYIAGPYLRKGSTVDRVIRDLANQNLYTRIPFPGVTSAIYAPDLAEWAWHSAFSPNTLNQTFFAAHPDAISIRAAFDVIAQGLKAPCSPYPCPKFLLPLFKRWMLKEGFNPLLAKILFDNHFYCDASPLASALDRRLSHTAEAALMKTVRWLQAHPQTP